MGNFGWVKRTYKERRENKTSLKKFLIKWRNTLKTDQPELLTTCQDREDVEGRDQVQVMKLSVSSPLWCSVSGTVRSKDTKNDSPSTINLRSLPFYSGPDSLNVRKKDVDERVSSHYFLKLVSKT